MKTITMDFETWEKELNTQWCSGYREAILNVEKIIAEVKKGELSEAHTILCEMLEEQNVNNERYHQIKTAIEMECRISPPASSPLSQGDGDPNQGRTC